jgi:hypothetical protein
MRNLTSAATMIALCLCLSAGSALAAPHVVVAADGDMYQTSYNNRGDQRSFVENPSLYPGDYFSPQGRYNSHQRRHHRYFGWHGYLSPTWRYPRSFPYHQFGH